MRALLIWAALATATLAPIVIAATSPLLAYRDAAYIIGGFAGITALSLLLIQPLLAANLLPLTARSARKLHRATGTALVVCTLAHIAGLYITSPPDTLDALLLVSPTPFSVYGVTALWAIIASATLVTLRKRIPHRIWTIVHTALALIITSATAIHAVQIQGAMGPISKWILCLLTVTLTAGVIVRMRRLRALAKAK